MKVKIIFISIFIVLAFYASQLNLFIDDYLFYYNSPRLVENLFIFFQNYTVEFGIYRPIAVLFYYLLFSIYQYSSSLSHLIPLAVQVFCGYLLYQILLKQNVSNNLSLILSLLFTLHPFAAEQYLWLAASQGVLASLFFLIQVLIIQNSKNFTKTLLLIFSLSLLSIFNYESTFFFFVPLIYLIYHRYHHSFPKICLATLSPIPFYLISKILFKPQNPRPLVNSFSQLIHNSSQLLNNLFNTSFGSYYQNNFWNNYSLDGYLNLLSKPPILIIFIFFLAFLLFTLFSNIKINSKPNNQTIVFWFLVFISSLPPLILNQSFYFGFRALFLPVITGIIFTVLFFDQILEKNLHRLTSITLIFFIIICTFVTINFSQKLQKLFQDDQKLAVEISKIAPSNTTIFLKSENPFDSRDTFLHADHLLSCFFYEWSAPACLKSVGINNDIYVKNFEKVSTQSPIIHLLYQSNGSLINQDL